MAHSSCVRNNRRWDLWVYAKDGKNGESLQIVSLMNISGVSYTGLYHIIWATDHNGSAVPPGSKFSIHRHCWWNQRVVWRPMVLIPTVPSRVTTNHVTFESFVQYFSTCEWRLDGLLYSYFDIVYIYHWWRVNLSLCFKDQICQYLSTIILHGYHANLIFYEKRR